MVTSTGQDTGWNPGTNLNPFQLYSISGTVNGNILYVTFISSTGYIGGQTRNSFAALDLNTGLDVGIDISASLRDSHINFPASIKMIQIIPSTEILGSYYIIISETLAPNGGRNEISRFTIS